MWVMAGFSEKPGHHARLGATAWRIVVVTTKPPMVTNGEEEVVTSNVTTVTTLFTEPGHHAHLGRTLGERGKKKEPEYHWLPTPLFRSA